MPKLQVLSFFSGALGLDLGLEAAGLETICYSEINPVCQETIKTNRPNIPILGDIRNYSGRDIRWIIGYNETQPIDVIVGGPPCQAFSMAGVRKSLGDSRGLVLITFLELIGDLLPKYIVIENVRGLYSAVLDGQPSGVFKFLLKYLKDLGYGISFNLYNTANFGTPQRRERIIIIGSRDGHKLPYLVPTHSPNGEYGLPKWRTLRDALENLVENTVESVPLVKTQIKYLKVLSDGQSWKDLPKDLQREITQTATGNKVWYKKCYRRLAWDQPSPTLLTAPCGGAALIHPVEDRYLSVGEYKRIQEFPDDFILCGSRTAKYKQIGNAIPVGLATAVGKLLIAHTNNQVIPRFPRFPYSKYHNTSDKYWDSFI